MNTQKLIAIASALLAAASLAQAGTLSGATTTHHGVSTITNPPKITVAGQIVQVKHYMGVLYYGPDKNPDFACGAKLEFSDGTASEMIKVRYPMEGVARVNQYTKPGNYTVSLTGFAHTGLVACLGWATTSLNIEDGLTPFQKPGSNAAGALSPTAISAGLTPAMAPDPNAGRRRAPQLIPVAP